MKKSNKKGFTIVELVIVIAVIAILAAVLIPTFSNLIKRANLSADQQAIRQMNTILAANEILEGKSIFELYNALAEAGIDGENYEPITKDTMFFWDVTLNRILHVDSSMKVLAPAEYADKTYDPANDTWISLSMELFEANIKAPAIAEGYTDYQVSGYEGADVNVKITTAGELAFVFDYLNEEIAKNEKVLPKSYTIDLGGNVIDMMGATISIDELDSPVGNEKSFTIKNGTIKNISLLDPTSLGDGKTPGGDGQYGAGLIAEVTGDLTLTIDNVDFYGIHVNNSNVSQAGILVGYTSGADNDDNLNKIVIKDVNIYNSSLLAHRSAGALIGNSAGDRVIELTNIYMENVDVKTVGGRSAFLIGYLQSSTNDLSSSNIELKNCRFSLYECAQNTGTSPNGDPLGLQGDGTVWSYCYDGDGSYNYNNDKKYVANALMLITGQADGSEYFAGAVTGWN